MTNWRLFLVATILASFTTTASFGSGWVKNAGDFYLKLSRAAGETEFDDDVNTLSFTEESERIGLYAEMGLGLLPWSSQVILTTARKSIKRESVDLNDSHRSTGLIDTDLVLKHAVGQKQFSTVPLSILLAMYTGGVLPTTSKKFRVGREDERYDEVPEGRETLVAPLDQGKIAYIYGAGVTFYFAPVWLNLAHTTRSQSDAEFQTLKFESSLGTGLPFNSWLQFNFSQTKSPVVGIAASTAEVTSQNIAQFGGSLGLTVFQGLALEGGYTIDKNSDDRWEPTKTWEFGLSYRSL